MISTAATVLCPAVTDPPSPTPAGWFPDPLGRHEHRYFNGTSWTADVSSEGHRYVDPLGTAPGPAPGADRAARNGIATAALVCGIVGMVIAWIPFVVVAGFILAVLAVVFGVRGLRRSAPSGTGRGAAITGIVTGGIGLALSIVGIALSVVMYRAVEAFIDPGPVSSEVTSCTIEARLATVTGTVTNRGRSTADYTVFVSLDERTDAISIDDVAPDDTAGWTTTMRAPASSDCDPTIDVQGPFPFGIEIDPIDN
jgi:hypothetical protein